MKNYYGQEVRSQETSLSLIADALVDRQGPGNLTDAVIACVTNLERIAKSLDSINKSLDRINNNMTTLINVTGDQ